MITYQNLRLVKPMVIILIGIAFAFLISNLISKEFATQVSLTMYIPVTASLLVLSIIISKRFGLRGSHGKAWFLFLVFAVLWFSAERIAFYDNIVLGEEPFPSAADIFWLIGYPFLFAFMIWYLLPLKSMISKKILTFSIAISSLVLFFSLYIVNLENSESDTIELLIGLLYPIGDAILLVPAILGISLFVGGRVNFLWTLMCIAIVLETVADTGFLLATFDDSYYEGHPVDILFNWYYVIFCFAVYHHITLFRDHKKDPYREVEKFR